jgi:hypothetical protein
MRHETEHQQEASSERRARHEKIDQHEIAHQDVAFSAGPDGDEEPERPVREPVSFGMSVAGTVAAFVAGFGILPSSTLTEKAFILIIAIALSGAIICGIGAWRSVKRFLFMAISVGVAFTGLAALAIVAQGGAIAAQATGTPNIPSPVSEQSASGTPSPTPAVTGTSSADNSQPANPGTPASYPLKYSHDFTLSGDGSGCQSIEYHSYVLFGEQGPKVTPTLFSSGEPNSPWDMIMNCSGPTKVPDIEFSGSVATISGTATAAACHDAINTDPMSTGIDFAKLNPGMQICMINNGANEIGDELILVTLKSVSTTTYNSTWTATVWDLPAST